MGLFVTSERITFTNLPLACTCGPSPSSFGAKSSAPWEVRWESFLSQYRNTALYRHLLSGAPNNTATQHHASLPVDTSVVSLGKRIGIADCYTLYNVMLPDMLVGWLVFRHKLTGSYWTLSEQQREMYDIADNKVHGPKGPLIPINIVK